MLEARRPRSPRRGSGRRRARSPSTRRARSRATASCCSASTPSTGRPAERTRCCSCVTGATISTPRASAPSGSRATRPGRTRPGRRRSASTNVPLLSDWNGEATRGFGVAVRGPGDGGRLRAQRVPDRGRYGQGLVDARERDAGRRRRDRGGFVALALALYAACAIWATWPAVQHIDGHYLARPAAGYGEAAAGDHLQLGWAFWLPGHQLEQRRRAVGRPVLVPARGEGGAEPAGVAARDPVLAAARTCSGTSGPTTSSSCSPIVAAGGARLLVAAGARARPRRRARRRARLRARALPASASRPGTCSA